MFKAGQEGGCIGAAFKACSRSQSWKPSKGLYVGVRSEGPAAAAPSHLVRHSGVSQHRQHPDHEAVGVLCLRRLIPGGRGREVAACATRHPGGPAASLPGLGRLAAWLPGESAARPPAFPPFTDKHPQLNCPVTTRLAPLAGKGAWRTWSPPSDAWHCRSCSTPVGSVWPAGASQLCMLASRLPCLAHWLPDWLPSDLLACWGAYWFADRTSLHRCLPHCLTASLPLCLSASLPRDIKAFPTSRQMPKLPLLPIGLSQVPPPTCLYACLRFRAPAAARQTWPYQLPLCLLPNGESWVGGRSSSLAARQPGGQTAKLRSSQAARRLIQAPHVRTMLL